MKHCLLSSTFFFFRYSCFFFFHHLTLYHHLWPTKANLPFFLYHIILRASVLEYTASQQHSSAGLFETTAMSRFSASSAYSGASQAPFLQTPYDRRDPAPQAAFFSNQPTRSPSIRSAALESSAHLVRYIPSKPSLTITNLPQNNSHYPRNTPFPLLLRHGEHRFICITKSQTISSTTLTLEGIGRVTSLGKYLRGEGWRM